MSHYIEKKRQQDRDKRADSWTAYIALARKIALTDGPPTTADEKQMDALRAALDRSLEVTEADLDVFRKNDGLERIIATLPALQKAETDAIAEGSAHCNKVNAFLAQQKPIGESIAQRAEAAKNDIKPALTAKADRDKLQNDHRSLFGLPSPETLASKRYMVQDVFGMPDLGSEIMYFTLESAMGGQSNNFILNFDEANLVAEPGKPLEEARGLLSLAKALIRSGRAGRYLCKHGDPRVKNHTPVIELSAGKYDANIYNFDERRLRYFLCPLPGQAVEELEAFAQELGKQIESQNPDDTRAAKQRRAAKNAPANNLSIEYIDRM